MRNILLGSAAALGLSGGAAAAPQTYVEVLATGDPALHGGTVRNIASVAVSDDGTWSASISNESFLHATVTATEVVFEELQPVSQPPGAFMTVVILHHERSPQGKLAARYLFQHGGSASNQGLGYDGDVLLYEGQPIVAPGLPAGTTFERALGYAVPQNGIVYAGCELSGPGGPFGAVLRFEIDEQVNGFTAQVVVQEGDVLPGQTDPVTSLDIVPDGAFLAANSAGNVAYEVRVGAGQARALYLDDELVVQRWAPCPLVPGEFWGSLSDATCDVNERGGLAFRADLFSGVELVVYEDRVVRAGGDPVPGVPGEVFDDDFDADVCVTKPGEVLYSGRWGSAPEVSGIFLEDELIVHEGMAGISAAPVQMLASLEGAYDISPNGRFIIFTAWFDDGVERAILVDRGERPRNVCLGDGGAAGPCPCSNETSRKSAEGCANSQGHGAYLGARGGMVVGADDATFAVYQARPSQPCVLVQGSSLIAVPFRDGVWCMGSPTERIEALFTDGNGYAETTVDVAAEGAVSPMQTRYYQLWYRDPALSVCGTGSNVSQGLEVPWR